MQTLDMSINNEDAWINAVEEEGYSVLKCIDSGSFSDVFTIRQNNSDKIFALKKIESRHPIEEDEYIVNEIRCLYRLRHRHVIQLKDAILTVNTACIIMEYAPLGNLQQYVQDKTKLGTGYIFNTFGQLLSGMNFCHKNNIAHRDLNPSNILLMSTTLVKLGDFGLGFICIDDDGSPRVCNEYLGQNAYLAPEVLMECPFSPKPADIWSLGCILYFMCFNSKPFTGSKQSIMEKQLEQGLALNLETVTTPPLFVSTMYDMCCVDINRRHTVDSVTQQWLNSNMEES